MPNSFWSLFILIAFLAPGFFLVIEVRKKNPLFCRTKSQIEFILWVCLASLGPPLVLLALASIVVLLFAAISQSSDILSTFFSMTIGNVIPQKLQTVEFWKICIFLVYLAFCFSMAKILGVYFSRSTTQEKPGTIDHGSAWLDAFSRDHSNFVYAQLDNGYVVMGKVLYAQTDVEALISGGRDLVLKSAKIVDPNGHCQQDKISDRVVINSRDIKVMEITEGECHVSEKTNTAPE